MSPVLTKILIAVGAVATFCALAFIIYSQQQIKSQQMAIQTQIVQQQQLVDGILRSQSQYATKDDINKFAQDNNLNLKAIEQNLKSLGAQVEAVNVAYTSSQGQVANNLPSSGTGPANPDANKTPTEVNCPNGGTVKCPNNDPYGYQKNEQDLALNEDIGTLKVPFGTVGFSAWQKNPWNINIYPKDFVVDTVVGEDENERDYFYNKFTVVVHDNVDPQKTKTITIPVTSGTTKQEYPSSKFTFWNPRLLMGLDGGLNINHLKGEFTPNVNLGVMSYGQYKTTPDFSILQLGVGYGTVNKSVQLTVTPVAYNIGRSVFHPLMNNTYIGPSLTVGTDGSVGVGAGIRVGF